LKGMRFDCCYIGADGIDIVDGIMAADVDTVHFDELLASHSGKVIVLANSAKFSKHSLIAYMPVSSVSLIVTDNALPAEQVEEYNAADCTVVCV